MRTSFDPSAVDFSKIKTSDQDHKFGYSKGIERGELRWIALFHYISAVEGNAYMQRFYSQVSKIKSLLGILKPYKGIHVRCPSLSFHIDEDLSPNATVTFHSLGKALHIVGGDKSCATIKSLTGPDVALDPKDIEGIAKCLVKFDPPEEPKPIQAANIHEIHDQVRSYLARYNINTKK